ncbi:response regulator [Candidatus Aminicenantes bacterium AC-708-M15]|nr:response regulator [SCandidatus Aminicenantes bacterium Aminicenantia_JdfR_composite]MCP2596359.1 response regulator [Candidatus Aminicenantes bacterium AC-335-G13]MCP2598524.1 response regulator [Candidatus Aminicenantes bacterium AC-335-L06]MCP2604111.1 response regulator [Candidatus Aminicenantes bacterium AC-708-M15]MCP2605400.1 response regulator [Candidatus Aminicenantes bacterium AC-335-O07]MCP2605990.1 response regulator [Candidatus Aminicenantes bacterium AC-708-I09]MCP2617833.1 r
MKTDKLLVVDDEEGIRNLLSDFLTSKGYYCTSAPSAEKALEILESENDYSLVLSDIKMPTKSGLELLKEIKQNYPEIEVIMISALRDIDLAIEAMSNGAFNYITKPFKLQEVLITVEQALERRRLILENKRYQENLEELVKQKTIDLEETLRELRTTYNSTLESFIVALDARDTETQTHSQVVTQFTLTLAKKIGIKDGEELENIRKGALLHDIGKIGIPDKILKKPGKLTTQEWEIIKQHPIIGYKMISGIKFLKEASQIVLHHHEHFDGNGYPAKLKGNSIPLGARIFAVADALEALISDRPYRKALPIEEAKKEIIRCSGSQFDPKVVEAFLSIPLEDWLKIKEKVEKEFKTKHIL